MKIIMLGPQASGKGTQAALVADEQNIPHISTGDILRQNIKDRTELGRIAESIINKGNLVPDDIINKVVEKRLLENDCEGGFVLDGYPRNIEQATVLASYMKIDFAIDINISDKEAIKRISGRRTCEKCGEIYSIYAEGMDFNNVCKKCGGQLIVRDDDKEDAVRKRLDIYHQKTEPLINFYREKGILETINGERPIKNIFTEIMKKIKN